MRNIQKLIKDAREFSAASSISVVSAHELDRAVGLIRNMLDALEDYAALQAKDSAWLANQDAAARKCGCASCLKWLHGAWNIASAAAEQSSRFANDEYLGKIRVEDNSRTMLGRWAEEEVDPHNHFHIWSDIPCKGGTDCPTPEGKGEAR